MATTYLICAAGLGTRMHAVHPTVPKPLLRLQGLTFLTHSVSCLPLERGDRVIVIGLKKHGLRRAEQEVVAHCRPATFEWIELENPTGGALETALRALSMIPTKDSFAIFNADSVFECDALLGLTGESDGIIPCSIETGDEWSFCSVESDKDTFMRVTAVAEKKRIAKWCSIGFYWFRDREMFFSFAREEIQSAGTNELYVAPIYNRYINAGKLIHAIPTSVFKAMGTPEQARKYWNVELNDLIEENKNSIFE